MFEDLDLEPLDYIRTRILAALRETEVLPEAELLRRLAWAAPEAVAVALNVLEVEGVVARSEAEDGAIAVALGMEVGDLDEESLGLFSCDSQEVPW